MKLLLLPLLLAVAVSSAFAEEDDDAPFAAASLPQSPVPFSAPIQMIDGANTYDTLMSQVGSGSDRVTDDMLSRYSMIESEDSSGGSEGFYEVPAASTKGAEYDFYSEVKKYHTQSAPKFGGSDSGNINWFTPYSQYKPPAFGTYQGLADMMKESTSLK